MARRAEAVRSPLGLTRLHVLGTVVGGMLIIAWLVDRKPQESVL